MPTDTCYATWVESNTQWIDYDDQQWGECLPGLLNQIWTDTTLYVYAALDLGFEVIDIVTENKVAYIDYSGGFSTVWANDTIVFLGTSTNGISILYKTDIIADSPPTDLASYSQSLNFFYGTSSNNIRYLHGNNDFLLCVTDTEVDILKLDNNTYRSSSTTVSGNAYKGFMTSTGKFYYTTVSPQWSVNRVDKPIMDWTTPHATYVADGTILASGIAINDIFVTEGTSSNGIDNVLLIATSSGVYVIDENDSFDIYNTTGSGYSIVPGLSSNFTAVWADENSSLSSGKLYVASEDAFTIIDLETKTVYDRYTQELKGRGNEVLDTDGIIDINVV